MIALLITGIFLVTASLVALVFVSVKLLRTFSALIQLVDRVHIRGQVHLSDTLDRLMAVDFESYRAWRASDTAEEGGFFTQREQRGEPEQTEQPGKPSRWGRTSRGEDIEEALEELEVPDDRLSAPEGDEIP